jgi:hypothetical protein
MPTEAGRSALLDELLCIADSEWALGHWYIKLVRNGRSITDFSSIAALAQDELGHARAMFRFLEDEFDYADYELEFNRGPDEIHSMALLDEAPESWGDMVLSCMLAETGIECLARTFEGGSLKPVSSMLARFSQENYFHRLYLQGWLSELSEPERHNFRSSLERKLPVVGAWLGVAGTGGDILVKEGLRSTSVVEAREYFLEGLSNRLAGEIEVDGAQLSLWASPGEQRSWDTRRRRPHGSGVPSALFEFMVPTNDEAQLARRPLRISVGDNIDLVKPPARDETDPQF